MRSKVRPPPAKRRRTGTPLPHCSHPDPSPETVRWAHAEWFLSALDEPYFTHSEFRDVVSTDMGLASLFTGGATRLQWARVRAAMCNAVPGGFAKPRRLSRAYLDAERAELAMYRRDARRVLRDEALPTAVDVTSGNPLSPEWWSRHRCPPPFPPSRGAPVLVRVVEGAVAVGGAESGSKSKNDSDREIRVVNASFEELEGSESNRVRLAETGKEVVVSDLDVMSVVPSPFLGDSLLQASPSPLIRRRIRERDSPTAAFVGLSPSVSLPDPSAALDFTRYTDAPSSLIQIYQSPRTQMVVSPQRAVAVKSRNRDDIECEVDVQQLADSQRLMNRKEDLILKLRALNDSVGSCQLAGQDVDEDVREQYNFMALELDDINAQLAPLFTSDVNQATGLTPGSSRGELGNLLMQSLERTPEPKKGSLFLTRPGVITPSPRSKPLGKGTPPGGPLQGGHARTLRPEHMAKNVDFRTATGAALLAKALTRSSFADLGADSKLKNAPTSVRADVMECVSACVAVLVRARATRNYECIEEVIDSIRVRFSGNREALEAIHAAARTFESSSSESS